MASQLAKRRVVVTGMGIVSSLGVGVKSVWRRLCEAESGITKLDPKVYGGIPCEVAGVIPRGTGPHQYNAEEHFSKSESRTLFAGTCYSIVAAKEALAMARWEATDQHSQERTGVAVGMGMSDMDTIVEGGIALKERGYKRVSPHFVPRILTNMPAGHLTLRFGFKGPNHSVSTACTTGLHAVGDAATLIRLDKADVMLCGGTEASLSPLAVAAFARMRALSTRFNDRPAEASRPFDAARDGFVMSEGAGILVLEELAHAQKRGARIYGEVLGYGLSADSNHITAPCEDGDGAYRCMKMALRDAGVSSGEVGYINAHATSTPLGDAAESRAITRLFDTDSLAVSSTKGATGHMQGAAGSAEAIFTVLACHNGLLPPTLNCHNPDEEFAYLNYVPLTAQTWNKERRVALTNSYGFGGTNGSLCISNFVE